MRTWPMILAVGVVCGFTVVAQAGSPAVDGGFVVADTVGGEHLDPIALIVENGQASVTKQLFITWTGSRDLTGVTLSAFVTGATATVGLSSDPLTLTPNEPVAFSITVKDIITEEKTLHGSVVVAGAEDPPPPQPASEPLDSSAPSPTEAPRTAVSRVVTTLEVTIEERTGAADVTFVGVTDDSTKTTTQTDSGSISLRLRNAGPVDVMLTPEASPVTGPTGTAATVDSLTAVTVPAGEVRDFTLIMNNMSAVGEYSTFVNVRLGGPSDPQLAGPQLKVVIERVIGDLKLTVTVAPPSALIETGEKPTATFEVKNDGALPITLTARLGSPKRMEGTKEDSADLKPGTVTCAPACTIPSGAVVTVSLPIRGFGDPGTYTVPINLTDDAFAGQQTTTFTVNARSPVGWALLYFGIGVAILGAAVVALQALQKRTADKVVLARTLEPLKRLVWGSPLPEHEQRIRTALVARARAANNLVGEIAFADTTETLANQIALAGLWLRVEQERTRHGLRLVELITMLWVFEADALDKSVRDQYLRTLGQLYDQTLVELREQQLRRGTALWKSELTNDDLGTVTAKLDEAITTLADPTRATAADRLLTQADVAFRTLVAARVASYAERPEYAGDVWDAVGARGRAIAERVATDTDAPADVLIRLALGELKTLLVQSAGQLATRADADADAGADDPANPMSSERRAELRQVARAARQLVLSTNTLSERRMALTELVATWTQQRAALPPPVEQATAVAQQRADASPTQWVVDDLPRPETAKRWALAVTVFSAVFAAAVAVLAALAFVYWPNATWGSDADRIAAILWGVGLSSTTQFTGYAAFRKSLFV